MPVSGSVRNPWLDIPLADYERHMALPQIAQAQLLSDVFADVLTRHAPRSVAVLGCAGGNGFDRISPQITERVVGVDLNPEYAREVQARFKDRIPGLEVYSGDVQTVQFSFSPVDLVYAALFFEYVDADTALARVRSMLNPNGMLVDVLQLPSTAIPEVSPSPFESLQALSTVMHLVPPKQLEGLAEAHGFHQVETRVVESAGGKHFQVQVFRLQPESGRRRVHER